MGRHYRRLGKTAVIVLATAVAIRLAPLLWTPYPFNPDGFVFAARARDALASWGLPLAIDRVGDRAVVLGLFVAPIA